MTLVNMTRSGYASKLTAYDPYECRFLLKIERLNHRIKAREQEYDNVSEAGAKNIGDYMR